MTSQTRVIPKGGDGAGLASMPLDRDEVEPTWNHAGHYFDDDRGPLAPATIRRARGLMTGDPGVTG